MGDSRIGPRWSKVEDSELELLVQRYGLNAWEHVAVHLQQHKHRRTGIMCANRWKQVVEIGMTKGPWTEEEDGIIRQCVQEGVTKWSEVAKRLPGNRIGKQCRERWSNHLDPQLKKTPWTLEEDLLLSDSQQRFGNSWTRIATEMVGRSENDVKNRWNSAARKRVISSLSGIDISKRETKRVKRTHSITSEDNLCPTSVSTTCESTHWSPLSASNSCEFHLETQNSMTGLKQNEAREKKSSEREHSQEEFKDFRRAMPIFFPDLSSDDHISLQFAELFLESVRTGTPLKDLVREKLDNMMFLRLL